MVSAIGQRRSADAVFTSTADIHLFWQDLTEAGSLKLREILKYCARGESDLWHTQFDGDAFWRESGQTVPFFFMEAEASPQRLHVHHPARVTHTRRFGREVDERGRVSRLISHGDTRIECLGSDGRMFQAGRLMNYGFFVRRSGPRDRRRVKRLHPSLNLTPVPKRILEVPTMDDLRHPPAGWNLLPLAGRFGLVRDAEPQIWTYSDTDGNHHVHSMSYVSRMEDFVLTALGRREVRVERYYPRRARVLFRRPCHNGELYIRSGQFYRSATRAAFLFIGAFHPYAPDDGGAIALSPKPNALVQMEIAHRPDVAYGELLAPSP